MRARSAIGAVLLVAACSYENPAYDSGNETGSVTSGLGSSGETSTGEVEPPEGLCDLYAINEQGQLRIIDADTGTSRVMLQEPLLDSWSIATHGMTGVIYLSPRDVSTDLLMIDPVTTGLDSQPIMIGELDRIARATFHGDDLWLGTDQNSRFVAVDPGTFMTVDDDIHQSGEGGDMVFIDQDHALVVTLMGAAEIYDFNTGIRKMVLFSNAGVELSGLAYDGQGRLWASTAAPNGQLHDVTVVENDDGTFDVTAGPLVDLNGLFSITDLATVVTPSDDC